MSKFPPFSRQGALSPWHDVEPGDGLLPAQFTAIIEIPLGSSNKYELDTYVIKSFFFYKMNKEWYKLPLLSINK